jgi:MoxR-like ATPase
MSSTILSEQLASLKDKLAQSKAQINTRFFGQERVVDQVLTTMLAGGHAVLVGVPGVGKTRLVETMATVMGVANARVQFTPDLMPTDILGVEVLDEVQGGKRQFRFQQGPVFTSLLLADEINRASPRTQSALLQAMQERQVTIAGVTHDLPNPFVVLATQNPIEQEGTYPLPEAQLDRFLLSIEVGYPDLETERAIILETTGADDGQASAVFEANELIGAQALIRQIPLGESVLSSILELVRALRPKSDGAHESTNEFVSWGPGPRAGQALVLAAKAHAIVQGRLSPTMSDVHALAHVVLGHRMSLKYTATAQGLDVNTLIDSVLSDIEKRVRAA